MALFYVEKTSNGKINLYKNINLKQLIKEGLYISPPNPIILQPYQTFNLITNIFIYPPYNKEIYFKGNVLTKNGNIYILDNYYRNNNIPFPLNIMIINKSNNENIIEENDILGEITYDNYDLFPLDEDFEDYETKCKLKNEILSMQSYMFNFLNNNLK